MHFKTIINIFAKATIIPPMHFLSQTLNFFTSFFVDFLLIQKYFNFQIFFQLVFQHKIFIRSCVRTIQFPLDYCHSLPNILRSDSTIKQEVKFVYEKMRIVRLESC